MAYNVYFQCEKCGNSYCRTNYTISLTRATKIARKKGWQVGKKGWFCPNCRTTKRKWRMIDDN